MKQFKQNKKSTLIQEPLVAYKKKPSTRKKSITQLLVTPKNNRSLAELKKKFNKMEEVVDVEIIEDGEVRDDELVKKMIASKKSGYASEAAVMATLNKIINGK
jgi:hypothetical protein